MILPQVYLYFNRIPGNRHDVVYLKDLVDELREEYGVTNAVMIAVKGFVSHDKLQRIFRDKKQYLVTILGSNMNLDSYLGLNANLRWFLKPEVDSQKRIRETGMRLTKLIKLYGNMDYWIEIRKDIEHAFGKIKDFLVLARLTCMNSRT